MFPLQLRRGSLESRASALAFYAEILIDQLEPDLVVGHIYGDACRV